MFPQRPVWTGPCSDPLSSEERWTLCLSHRRLAHTRSQLTSNFGCKDSDLIVVTNMIGCEGDDITRAFVKEYVDTYFVYCLVVWCQN